MNLNGLNFDHIPPFNVPSRFFVAASLFGLLCALIVATSGGDIWQSRWHPATLALTHAAVLGVISSSICGALFQLLPVLGGVALPQVTRVSAAVLIGLAGGTLLLVGGFYFSFHSLMWPAVLMLASVLTAYSTMILWQLKQQLTSNQSIKTIKFSLMSLLVLVVFGVIMLADYLLGTQYNSLKLLTDNHATWGLIGWVSLMIIGVSFQVLPMFHVAPAFGQWCTRGLPLTLITTLLLSGIAMIFNSEVSQFLLTQLIKIILIIYGVTALKLLAKRKRKISDPSVSLWQVALTTLVVICLFSLIGVFYSDISIAPLAMAALFIFGWIISVIMAMSIKIMPFLAYLNLQQLCGHNFEAFSLLPNVHQLLSKTQMNRLMVCHLVSMALLIVTLVVPAYYYLFALALTIQFGYLLVLLNKINSQFYKIKKAINEL
jgi:hypothetical protein